ncbi:TetR/AcrR family transcriptional regulator [Gordonia sp. TBRC 11910]|uniref:TetR/AcrR family transcriptional regulator n=1 Tax=Gordonia asplenii TaxID=2725283 RepID=A0A848KQK6_9ACTN|nr:TetR/AcrR family transcriptional regulator [Gordonia asplenii]NMO00630.1 TetR/AcrR family transcriptional regulator [Gordonia asplenii]
MTTRRRGAALEAALHAAIFGELTELGYSGTTYEGVAARAGTSKPVLYRRWPTKAEMVVAAITARVAAQLPALADDPGAGDLRTDLASRLIAMRELAIPDQRRTALGLLADLDVAESGALDALLFTHNETLMSAVIERARIRGELGSAPIPAAAVRMPMDLARHHILIRGSLSDDQITAVVDDITVPLWRLHSGADGPADE